MRDLTVTIGRQNGSGGREVGKVLADRLGVECYDRTVIEKTADRMGIPVEDAERMEERARTGSNLFFGGIPTANPLFVVQSDVIRSLASKGQCVFVGRCADYVLKDLPNVVHVFIWAEKEFRIERAIRIDGLTRAKAEESIVKIDRRRANYYNYHSSEKWGRAENYHLSIQSSYVGIDNAVELIRMYIEMGE